MPSYFIRAWYGIQHLNFDLIKTWLHFEHRLALGRWGEADEKAGPISVQGYAIAGEDQHIERVELSSDGGATWITATLQEQPQPWTWFFWEATVPLGPGAHQLVVRTWDSSGGTQPEDVKQVWNWKGYLNNAWHRVNVMVQ